METTRPIDSKAELARSIRKRIYSVRDAHNESEIDLLSREMTEKVVLLPWFQEAKQILAYMDYRKEARTCYLIQKAWEEGKEVAVPKCVGKRLSFRKITDFSQLEKGYCQIPEPVTDEEVFWEDALMLMPLVAFDRENHRLGYGGGYYDRYLAEHPGVFRIALALEFQQVESVPFTALDVLPHIVVTEKNIYFSNISK